MPIIVKLSGEDVFGDLALNGPGNQTPSDNSAHQSFQMEAPQKFVAKLFFLEIQDESKDQITPLLLESHERGKMRVYVYDSDSYFYVVLYEWQEDGIISHISNLLNPAREYCAKNHLMRKVYKAEEFQNLHKEKFKRIIKDILQMNLCLL